MVAETIEPIMLSIRMALSLLAVWGTTLVAPGARSAPFLPSLAWRRIALRARGGHSQETSPWAWSRPAKASDVRANRPPCVRGVAASISFVTEEKSEAPPLKASGPAHRPKPRLVESTLLQRRSPQQWRPRRCAGIQLRPESLRRERW